MTLEFPVLIGILTIEVYVRAQADARIRILNFKAEIFSLYNIEH